MMSITRQRKPSAARTVLLNFVGFALCGLLTIEVGADDGQGTPHEQGPIT